MLDEKGIRIFRYPCDKCEYAATRSSDLKKHKENKHEGIRYPCNICENIASTLLCLKSHKKYKHEGMRYPCEICGYSVYKHEHLHMNE